MTLTGVAGRTFTCVSSDGIVADTIITARLRHAVVDIDLATCSGETDRTRAFETVDHVGAGASIQTWIRFAFVDIDFALSSRESCFEATNNNN